MFHGPWPNTEHPAPFPEELPKQCLEAVGTEDNVVIDPMGGSMTTCEAAEVLGYESIGVDVNREYITILSNIAQQIDRPSLGLQKTQSATCSYVGIDYSLGQCV